jgi:hypothetical protein
LFNPSTTSQTATGKLSLAEVNQRDEMLKRMDTLYPNIAAITRETIGNPSSPRDGCDEQFEFEFALDLLLDAFNRLHQQGWSSTQTHPVRRSKGRSKRWPTETCDNSANQFDAHFGHFAHFANRFAD